MDESGGNSYAFKCTYALSTSGRANASNPTMICQAIYACQTCNDPNDPATANKCCCAGCAATCHDGHEVDFIAYGSSYCDCGATGGGGCCLIDESVAAANRLVGKRGIAFDEDGRIAGTRDTGLQISDFNLWRVSLNPGAPVIGPNTTCRVNTSDRLDRVRSHHPRPGRISVTSVERDFLDRLLRCSQDTPRGNSEADIQNPHNR